MVTRSALLALLLPAALQAQLAGAPASPAPPAPRAGRTTLELSASHHEVSARLGDWDGVAARLVADAGPSDTWSLELLGQRAFGDRGVWASVGNTHVFSADWHTFVSVGGGTGDFFFPELRADAVVSRKWLRSRRLVTSVGATAVRAKDEHRDYGATASVTGYLGPLLVAEAGARFTRSTPGDVESVRGFGALTFGRDGVRYVVARTSNGSEGYQLLGADRELVRRFSSYDAALAWREWVAPRWGITTQIEQYSNPLYRRTGASVGIFAHW